MNDFVPLWNYGTSLRSGLIWAARFFSPMKEEWISLYLSDMKSSTIRPKMTSEKLIKGKIRLEGTLGK
jgi:hypothetical protein